MPNSPNRMGPILVAAVLAISTSCGKPEPRMGATTDSNIRPGILLPADRDRYVAELELLQRLFPGAKTFTEYDLAGHQSSLLAEGQVIIAPGARDIPRQTSAQLEQYASRGGAVILWGPSPFSNDRILHENACPSRQDREDQLATNSRPLGARFSLPGWLHFDEHGRLYNTIASARDKVVPWPISSVRLDVTSNWTRVVSPPLSDAELQTGENTLIFYARRLEGAASLLLQALTPDGTWIAPIQTGPDWKRFLLREEDFFLHGKSKSSRAFRFIDSTNLCLGIDLSANIQPQGKHVFLVSEFHIATDREEPWTPGFQPLTNPDGLFPINAGKLHGRFSIAQKDLRGTPAESCFPRPRKVILPSGRTRRWIPFYTALQPNQEIAGWPVEALLEFEKDHPVFKVARIGVDLTPDTSDALGGILQDVESYFRNGWFLQDIEPPKPSYTAGADLNLLLGYVPGRGKEPRRITAELVDMRGLVIRRAASEALDPSAPGRVRLQLGTVPRVPPGNLDFSVRVILETIGGESRIHDEITSRFKVISPDPDLPDGDRFTTSGARITEGKLTRFFLGANYAPVTRYPEEDVATSMFAPDRFHPEIIRRDLGMLAAQGINTISIRLTDPAEIPAFEYLATECRARGLWIYLVLPDLDPLSPNLNHAIDLLNAAGVRYKREVVAIDAGARGSVGTYQDRMRLAPQWTAWINEQFGSTAHAQQLLWPLLRTSGILALPPTDEEFTRDGPHRLLVAVYRRFLEDTVSRNTGHIVRRLRDLEYATLFSSRRGDRMPGMHALPETCPIPLYAGALHLDFISLPAWGLFEAGTDELLRLLFLTAYGRGVSGGKPVVWRDGGFRLNFPPENGQESELERLFQKVFYATIRAQAAGFITGPYPGTGEDEHGRALPFWEPDGRPRPALRHLRDFATVARSIKGNTRDWSGLQTAPGRHLEGEDALWAAWGTNYPAPNAEASIEEIRLEGFNTPSTQIDPFLPGYGIFEEPAPLGNINAEWAGFEVDGLTVHRQPGEALETSTRSRVELLLLNTGAMAWVPGRDEDYGAVTVRVAGPYGKFQHIRVEATKSGQTFTLIWNPPSSGTWTLRPWLGDIGGFGEPLVVEVE